MYSDTNTFHLKFIYFAFYQTRAFCFHIYVTQNSNNFCAQYWRTGSSNEGVFTVRYDLYIYTYWYIIA